MRVPFLLLVPLLSLLSLPPALAAATPWQQVAPDTRLRLISSDTRAADGTTLVGLELDMPQTSMTYWQLPGETGIPTTIDITGSTGLADPVIQWPYPTPQMTGAYLDYVYHGPTVLPVRLKLTGEAPRLEAAVVMGVCSNVCVPVRASFSLPLDFGSPDSGQSIRLRQAEALAPIPWDQPAPPFADVVYDSTQHALRLDVTSTQVAPQSILAVTDDPTVIFGAPQKGPDRGSIVLSLRGKDRGTGWASSPIQLTFMTPMGSYEIRERARVTPP